MSTGAGIWAGPRRRLSGSLRTRRAARGITGWVRNRMAGSVELMLQGSPEQIADMCDWLRDGIPAALVYRLEVTQVQLPSPRFEQFDRLPTL